MFKFRGIDPWSNLPLHRKNLGESWIKVNPPDLQDAAVQNVLQQVAHRIREPPLYPAELRDH
jgi:hypothetical protein